jgi:hypothetical protein
MNNGATFQQVLEAIERLPADEQADLLEVVRRRLAERERRRIAADAQEARREHDSGQSQRASVDDLMGEIES